MIEMTLSTMETLKKIITDDDNTPSAGFPLLYYTLILYNILFSTFFKYLLNNKVITLINIVNPLEKNKKIS